MVRKKQKIKVKRRMEEKKEFNISHFRAAVN